MAELTFVEAKREEVTSKAFGQANVGKDTVYWIQSSLSSETPTATIQSFTSRGASEKKKVILPILPMILAPIYRSLQTKGLLLAYTDYAGKSYVTQINDSQTKVKKTVVLDTLILPTMAVLTQRNYVVGGIGNDDFASLVFIDENLSKQTKIDLPVKKKGEITSLFFDQKQFFAISSHFDATSYIHTLSLSGVVRSSTQLKGSGGNGIALGNRGFAISYRVGREAFIERFDGNMKSLWVKKLHDIAGVARKGTIHDMQDGIAWVGANNGKLTIYRLDDNGNVMHTSIDKSSDYGAPPSGNYLSMVLGRDIHIRGQASKSGGPVDGMFDSIYFIDDEK